MLAALSPLSSPCPLPPRRDAWGLPESQLPPPGAQDGATQTPLPGCKRGFREGSQREGEVGGDGGHPAASFPPKDLPGDMGECAGLASPETRPSRAWTAFHFGIRASVSVDMHDRPPKQDPRFGGAHTSWDSGHMQLTGYSGLEIVGLGWSPCQDGGAWRRPRGALLSSLSVGPGALCLLPPPPG